MCAILCHSFRREQVRAFEGPELSVSKQQAQEGMRLLHAQSSTHTRMPSVPSSQVHSNSLTERSSTHCLAPICRYLPSASHRLVRSYALGPTYMRSRRDTSRHVKAA